MFRTVITLIFSIRFAVFLSAVSTSDSTHSMHSPLHPSPRIEQTRASCTNALRNPSFETNHLLPWTNYASGSWAFRTITYSSSAYTGTHFFHAFSNSTYTSTTTLAQSNVRIPPGTKIDCSARIWAAGITGANRSASFEVFIDGTSCGSTTLSGGQGEARWMKVGRQVQLSADMREHMLVVVAVVSAGGDMGPGIGIGVDGVWAGPVAGC